MQVQFSVAFYYIMTARVQEMLRNLQNQNETHLNLSERQLEENSALHANLVSAQGRIETLVAEKAYVALPFEQ